MGGTAQSLGLCVWEGAEVGGEGGKSAAWLALSRSPVQPLRQRAGEEPTQNIGNRS